MDYRLLAIPAIWLSPVLILWVLRDRKDLLTWDNLYVGGGAFLLAMWASTCALSK